MSGPLVTWVGEHSKATWKGRAVLIQYAVAAYHDGTPAADVSRDDLERRTGLGRTTLAAGRQEAVTLGELVELERPGGGRGRIGRYRVAVSLCPPEADCWSCSILAGLLGENDRATVDSSRGNRPPGGRKRPPHGRKRPRGGPTTKTETYPPTGGTSPPGESGDARRSAPPRKRDSAARSSDGQPAPQGAREIPLMTVHSGTGPPEPVRAELERQGLLPPRRSEAGR